MSDSLVRLENLRAVMRSREMKPADLARAVMRAQQQVHAWLNGERNIGERLARDLEERLNLPRYALDERVTPNARGPEAQRPSPSANTIGASTSRPKEVPVLQFPDLDALLHEENGLLKSRAPHLETYAVISNIAKFLAMPDDSMAPEFAPGDHILFDPVEVPRAGEVVLVRIPSGEYFVRRFRPKTAHIFEVTPDNPVHLPLSSTTDRAVIEGVLIEHRRYRRPA